MRRFAAAAPIAALALFALSAVVAAAPVTGPIKWSQPAFQIGVDPTGLPIYWGWDEPSWSFLPLPPGGPQAADDWLCKDQLPVTDIHWWGSYPDWLDPAPPVSPAGFWFGIYTDIPVQPGIDYSRPGDLIWQYYTTDYIETFVGWDVLIPGGPPIDATFQYNVFLPETDWFYQPGANTILWLSIVAIYQPGGPVQDWGWKSRPHYFQDDAVRGIAGGGWTPLIGPDDLSWDLSFELSTVPEPGSLMALATGLVGVIGYGIRRKR